MIEELKIIIGLLGDIGAYGVWIVVGYLVFKLANLASILALIGYAIKMFHNWATSDRKTIITIGDGIAINNDVKRELNRFLKEELRDQNLDYIHKSDIDDLKEAWEKHRAKK